MNYRSESAGPVGASLPGAAPREEWEKIRDRFPNCRSTPVETFVGRLLAALEAADQCKGQLRRELAAELQRGAALEAGPQGGSVKVLEGLRCRATNNLCGTDPVVSGIPWPCECNSCQIWFREVRGRP